jgi:hypothetical protein
MTAWAVDVDVDVLGAVLLVEEQQLRNDRVGGDVVDLGADEDDAVLQQAAVNVIGALAKIALLDNNWYVVRHVRLLDRQ